MSIPSTYNFRFNPNALLQLNRDFEHAEFGQLFFFRQGHKVHVATNGLDELGLPFYELRPFAMSNAYRLPAEEIDMPGAATVIETRRCPNPQNY